MAGALWAGAGGIAGLLRFLEEYGEAVEWDMARYWPGRSLLELYRGEMSWRELRVFLRYLPPDSATHRSMHPRSAEEEHWTTDRQLAAALVDAVREQTFVMLKLQGDPKKTKRLKPPDPIPRPGIAPQRDTTVIRFGGRNAPAGAQLAAAFGGVANR